MVSARVALVAMVVAASLAAPAPAAAATVERVQGVDSRGTPFDSFSIEYAAAPGEANDLEIRLEANAVTFSDRGQSLEATNCEQVDPSTARCGTGAPVTIKLGDGDDTARVVDTRAPGTAAYLALEIDAGTGADRLTGGPGYEIFTDGGDGEADHFTGGGGGDLVSYAGRSRPVRVDLRAPGEDALDGIPSVAGGSGRDVLIGDARGNRLEGGPGRDRLSGLGGSDALAGDSGIDALSGGPGADVLSGDTYTSGIAADALDGGSGDDLLDLGVEDDEVNSTSGASGNVTADGVPDTARCGRGHDTVRYGDGSDTVRGCEAATLDDGFAIELRLRRVSPTRVRIRIRCPQVDECDRLPLELRPRGREGPRLARRIVVRRAGTRTLRLTTAGRRHLRRHRAVTIGSLSTDETIDARVAGG